MKKQERPGQEVSAKGTEKNKNKEPITSDSIKNAHAAGDGAMERSSNSVPDEEELEKGSKDRPPYPEKY